MSAEPQTSGARCAAVFEQAAADGWEPEELVAGWTLLEEDRRLVANKTGATRLGFALLLKFFELHARFAVSADELPPPSTTSPGRSASTRPSWRATPGRGGRSSITAHRSAGRSDSARPAAPTRRA
jgi:hypothetical protein